MSMTAGSGVEVVAIDTPALGDRSYLAHEGDIAVMVDPQRGHRPGAGPGRGPRGADPHVFETHLHNDYVTGGRP
jgi:hydroxyacylglutathione hydrolase